MRTQNPDHCEIRFVLEGDSAQVTLSAKEPGTTVVLFYGPFDSRQRWVLSEEPQTITVALTDRERALIAALPDPEAFRFAPQVCRLVFHDRGVALVHDIAGAIRAPTAVELPEKTLLAYGTSITHGAAATQAHLAWVSQTAWRLGADLRNLGVGGACLCEHAFADYIASLADWDLAMLNLSVNMIGHGFTTDGFEERVRYVVDTVSGAYPDKPVVCTSIFPYFGDWDHSLHENAKATAKEFRRILREIVLDLDRQNLHFIPGSSILTDVSGLTVDMIHPSDLGMITMGENMARAIRPLLS
jgi:lysophospholipase L1-like esterase